VITATYDKEIEDGVTTQDIAYNADDFTFKEGATDLEVGTSTFTAAGSKTITVTYEEVTATFNVTVNKLAEGVIWTLEEFITDNGAPTNGGNLLWETYPFQYGNFGKGTCDETAKTVSSESPRSNQWDGFELFFSDKSAGSWKGLDIDVSVYKVQITVEGKIDGTAAAGEKFVIQKAGGSYDTLVEVTLTGTVDETFNCTEEIPALFADFLNGTNNSLRIQTSDKIGFTITKLEVEITGEW